MDPNSVHYLVTLQSFEAPTPDINVQNVKNVSGEQRAQLAQSSMYRRLKLKPRKRTHSAITRTPFIT